MTYANAFEHQRAIEPLHLASLNDGLATTPERSEEFF